MICDLNKMGFVYEMTFEEARVKAREAWLACDYDPTTLQANFEGGDKGDVDQFTDSAWCDSAYGRDEEGEDDKSRGGDGH